MLQKWQHFNSTYSITELTDKNAWSGYNILFNLLGASSTEFILIHPRNLKEKLESFYLSVWNRSDPPLWKTINCTCRSTSVKSWTLKDVGFKFLKLRIIILTHIYIYMTLTIPAQLASCCVFSPCWSVQEPFVRDSNHDIMSRRTGVNKSLKGGFWLTDHIWSYAIICLW